MSNFNINITLMLEDNISVEKLDDILSNQIHKVLNVELLSMRVKELKDDKM